MAAKDDSDNRSLMPGKMATKDDSDDQSLTPGKMTANDDSDEQSLTPGKMAANNDSDDQSLMPGKMAANDDSDEQSLTPGKMAANDDSDDQSLTPGKMAANDDSDDRSPTPGKMAANDDSDDQSPTAGFQLPQIDAQSLNMERYFTPDELSKIGDYEMLRYRNLVCNHLALKALGIPAERPAFMDKRAKLKALRQSRPVLSRPEHSSSDEDDAEWTPGCEARAERAKRPPTGPSLKLIRKIMPNFYAKPAQSATAAASSQGMTSITASKGATSAPSSQGTTATTASKGATPTPSSQGTTATTVSKGAIPKTNGQGATPKTSGQGATPKTSGQGATPKTSGQGATPKTSSQGATPETSSQGATAADTGRAARRRRKRARKRNHKDDDQEWSDAEAAAAAAAAAAGGKQDANVPPYDVDTLLTFFAELSMHDLTRDQLENFTGFTAAQIQQNDRETHRLVSLKDQLVAELDAAEATGSDEQMQRVLQKIQILDPYDEDELDYLAGLDEEDEDEEDEQQEHRGRPPAHQPTNTRYPRRRSVPRRNYAELEVPAEDEFIYCEECDDEFLHGCPQHGPRHYIRDSAVPSDDSDPHRSTNSLPSCMVVRASKIPGAGRGVWTQERVPRGLVFGPYEGFIERDASVAEEGGYAWLVYRNGAVHHCVDAQHDRASNWMRYVNCARYEEEQNMMAFQYCGAIFYRTIASIQPDTELMVWYGEAYGAELGIVAIDSSIVATDSAAEAQAQPPGSATSTPSTALNSITRHTAPLSQHYSKEVEGRTLHCCGKCYLAYDNELMLLKHLKLAHHEAIDLYRCQQPAQVTATHTHTNHALPQPQQQQQQQQQQREEMDKIASGKAHSTDSQHRGSASRQSSTQPGSQHASISSHSGQRRHTCTVCGRGFTQSSDLKRHTLTHTGEKPHSCPQCGQGFALAQHLKGHMLCHTGEKPHTCPQCGQGFNQTSNLKIHMRCHTGEKPHTCPQCGQGFALAQHLKYHMRCHTGERPYRCTVCSKGFTQSESLRTHLRTHAAL